MKKFFGMMFSVVFSSVVLRCCADNKASLTIRLSPDTNTIITEDIQQAIDSAGNAGGGTVLFPGG